MFYFLDKNGAIISSKELECCIYIVWPSFTAHEEIELTKQEQKSVMEALLKERRLLEERFQQQQTELAHMNNHYKTLQSQVQAV